MEDIIYKVDGLKELEEKRKEIKMKYKKKNSTYKRNLKNFIKSIENELEIFEIKKFNKKSGFRKKKYKNK